MVPKWSRRIGHRTVVAATSQVRARTSDADLDPSLRVIRPLRRDGAGWPSAIRGLGLDPRRDQAGSGYPRICSAALDHCFTRERSQVRNPPRPWTTDEEIPATHVDWRLGLSLRARADRTRCRNLMEPSHPAAAMALGTDPDSRRSGPVSPCGRGAIRDSSRVVWANQVPPVLWAPRDCRGALGSSRRRTAPRR